ncbi:MAG: recombinase RecA [Betaproteobacteria bacterium]|nr:recombinase RecA [Betaproteobacteria bacterium]
MDDNKSKALAAALTQIEKQFGKGSIMKMGDAQIQNDLQVVSTGSLGLDIALGVGGLPRGRVVEIYGPESSGKTTLSLQVVAQVQKAGGTAAYIDAENALDPVYAGKLGVNVGELLISQPDTGEQALEIADMLVRSGGVDIIVIDSVAALVPKAEIEGEMGDQLPGLQARLMSQALRKLTANIKRANTLVIFINQIRMKIGVMFGNPETTTGGNALKFYASVRLDIRRIGAIKKNDEVIGNETRVKVVKNKVAPPFREALFDILYGEGISRQGEIIELGVAHDIIDKSGAWYAYNGEKIGQGKDNTREFLREHPEMATEIEAKIRAAVGVPQPGALRAPRARLRPTNDRRVGPDRSPRRRWRSPCRCAVAAVARLMSNPRPPRAARPPKTLKARAIGLLARREHSRAELRERLLATGADREATEALLDELAALGFLSDARFAHAVVRQKQGAYAQRAIADTLKQKGVTADAARAALADSPIDDATALAVLWRRRFGRAPADDREKARQVRFLQSRGFALSAIFRLLRDPPSADEAGGSDDGAG